jgi:hypothetical protein
MAKNLPYVTTVRTLERMLEKITQAAVPERFTQDFVATKLSMKGGTPRAIIPFIKKMGLVAGDGTPTDLYREFRNPNKSEAAMAQCIKTLYAPLFEMNEYAHELNDGELKGLIVESTGAPADSAVVKKTLTTFNALKKLSDFDSANESENQNSQIHQEPEQDEIPHQQFPVALGVKPANQGEGINLSYTINLNLPATTNIDIFNAIFKSLKEHLLQK